MSKNPYSVKASTTLSDLEKSKKAYKETNSEAEDTCFLGKTSSVSPENKKKIFDYLEANYLLDSSDSDLSKEDRDDGFTDLFQKFQMWGTIHDNDTYATYDGGFDNKTEVVFFLTEEGVRDYVEDALKGTSEPEEVMLDMIRQLAGSNYEQVYELWGMNIVEEDGMKVCKIKKGSIDKTASLAGFYKEAAGTGLGNYRRGKVLTDVKAVQAGQLLVFESHIFKAVNLVKVTETFADKFYGIFVKPDNPIEKSKASDEEFSVKADELEKGEWHIALEPAPSDVQPEVESAGEGGGSVPAEIMPVEEPSETPAEEPAPVAEAVEQEVKEEAEAPMEKTEASKKIADVQSPFVVVKFTYDKNKEQIVNFVDEENNYTKNIDKAKKFNTEEEAETSARQLSPAVKEQVFPADYFKKASKKIAIESPVRKTLDYGEKPGDIEKTHELEEEAQQNDLSNAEGQRDTDSANKEGCIEATADKYCDGFEQEYNAFKEGAVAVEALLRSNDLTLTELDPQTKNTLLSIAKKEVLSNIDLETLDMISDSYIGILASTVKKAWGEEPASICYPKDNAAEPRRKEDLITDDEAELTNYASYNRQSATSPDSEEEEVEEPEPVKEPKYELINHEPESDEEAEDFFDTTEAITIGEDGKTAYYAGREICEVDDPQFLPDEIHEWMEKNKYWPNVIGVSDHGNPFCYSVEKIGSLGADKASIEGLGFVGSKQSGVMSTLLSGIDTIASATGGEGDDGSAYDLVDDRNTTGVDENMVEATVEEYLNGKATSFASLEDFAGFVEDVYGIKNAAKQIENAWHSDDAQAIVSFIKQNAVKDAFKR
jgi:hypothetical protein